MRVPRVTRVESNRKPQTRRTIRFRLSRESEKWKVGGEREISGRGTHEIAILEEKVSETRREDETKDRRGLSGERERERDRPNR